MSNGVSRRQLFEIFTRPLRGKTRPLVKPSAPAETPPRVAVIQGRYCLAYTTFCSVCVERCPVEGAMTVTNGIPMVVPNVCTGCAVCHDVCPAPTNAVLMVPRRRTPLFTAPTTRT